MHSPPPFLVTPIVTASSNGFAPWRIREQSASGFTIELKDIAENAITFTWHAVGSIAPKTVTGEEGTHVRGVLKFPVDALGYPLSSSEIWNQCIRNQTPLDLDGQPFNCSRYHNEDLWTHPDLLVQFLWDYEADPKLVLPENCRIVMLDEETEESEETEDKDQGEETGTGSVTGSGSTAEDTGSGSTADEDTGTGSTTGSGSTAGDTGTGSTAGEGTGSGSTTDGGDDSGSDTDTGTGSTAGDGTGNAAPESGAEGEDDAGGGIFDGLKGLFE